MTVSTIRGIKRSLEFAAPGQPPLVTGPGLLHMDDNEFIWSWENMQRRISNCRDANIIARVWDGQREEGKKKPSATEGVKTTGYLHDVQVIHRKSNGLQVSITNRLGGE